jgi:hypothetical protein
MLVDMWNFDMNELRTFGVLATTWSQLPLVFFDGGQ